MKRNALVDRLKGYACFLVLFGHVIMGIRIAGVDIPYPFYEAEKFLWSFHVPLFLFLSGVVYSITGEWTGKKTKLNFICYKLLNLGVPYVIFSIVYIVINSLVANTNTGFTFTDIIYLWKTPVAQYWFLYALFFLFVIYTLLSGYLSNLTITVILVALRFMCPLFNIPLGSLEVVFDSALAFGLGASIKDFNKLCDISLLKKLVVILVHIILSVIFIKFNIIESHYIKELAFLLGIYSSIMLISILEKSEAFKKFLDFFNKYSFQIFLLHTIFTAGIRIVLIKLNVLSWPIHIIAGLLMGTFASVLCAVICEKLPVLNFVFFPSKAIKYINKKRDV